MKMILLVIYGVVLFLFGCSGPKVDPVRDFIPGIYYASWTTNFSKAVDTMKIEPFTTNGSEGYLITRRTHLQFINAAKKRVKEYAISRWQGYYAAADKTIVVQSKGRILYFDPGNKLLKMGSIIYKKL